MEDSTLPNSTDEFSSPPLLCEYHEVVSAAVEDQNVGDDIFIVTSTKREEDDLLPPSLEVYEDRGVSAADGTTSSGIIPAVKDDLLEALLASAVDGVIPDLKYDENFGPERHREVFYGLFSPIYEMLKATGHPILRSEEYNDIATFLANYEKGVSTMNVASTRWRKRYQVSTKQKAQDPVNLNDVNDYILVRQDRHVVMYDKLFDVIHYVHEQMGHPRDPRKQKIVIDENYYGVSEKVVKIFVGSCPLCLSFRGADKKIRVRESTGGTILSPPPSLLSAKKRPIKSENEPRPNRDPITRVHRKPKSSGGDNVEQTRSSHRTIIGHRSTTLPKESSVNHELLDKIIEDDPLLRLDGSVAPTLDATSTVLPMTLERAIYPLSLETFVTGLFRKKAVHIKKANNSVGGDPGLVAAMYNLNVPSILKHTSSNNVFVWVMQQHQQQGKHSGSNVIQSIEMDDPEHAYKLYKYGGHALYCRAPPEVEQPLVASFLAETGLGCGQYDPKAERSMCLGRGEVETFITPKNHITNFHTDFQENFTFQLSGVRKWRLKHGTVRYPLRGCTPHYAESPDAIEGQLKAARLCNPDFTFESPPSNSFGREEEVIMTAGDLLYFPAGMWHSVETLEEGISINVSLMATNYAALVTNALHHFLLTSDEQWRESVTSTGSNNLTVLENLHTLLTVKLPSVVQDFINLAGAESILPPVLRYPTPFVDGSGTAAVSGNEDESCSSNQAEDEDIVDVENFVGPEDWNCEKPNSDDDGMRVVIGKNPLATLISEHEDVVGFCENGPTSRHALSSGSTKKKRKVSKVKYFILNVNYAGNDTHESSVRVKFACHREADIDLFQRYVLMEKEGKDPAVVHNSHGFGAPRSCLFFYGYFAWLKEENNSDLVIHL
jgi:hypothetical protein